MSSIPPGDIISSSSRINELSSLENFILDSQVNGGGDSIQCEVFQALPEGGRKAKV